MIGELRKQMDKYFNEYTNIRNKLKKEVQKICDFEIDITYCFGDGFLILDIDTADTFTFSSLNGKSNRNKLTRDDSREFVI